RQKGRESPPSAFAPGAAVRQAIVVFALLAVPGFGIGDVERGNRHYRAGRYAEAVEAYQEAIRDGNNSPQVRYNLGTALLRLGRFDEAEQQLQLALAGVDPDLRQRAYYNLGNRYLEAARADSNAEGQDQLLDAAIDAYKQSLRLQPGDADAKWNLEMALREKDETPDPPPGGQGESQQQDDPQQNPQGGGGGSNDSPASEQEGPRQPGGNARNSMSREQADRILSAVEQDERDLTREKLRKGQRRTPVGRDW
ncbi:MAG: tetratricopeptide repeat protein, partial [Longimicrobiales bacterium]